MNINGLNVQEMSMTEMQDINGGSFIGDVWNGIKVGASAAWKFVKDNAKVITTLVAVYGALK